MCLRVRNANCFLAGGAAVVGVGVAPGADAGVMEPLIVVEVALTLVGGEVEGGEPEEALDSDRCDEAVDEVVSGGNDGIGDAGRELASISESSTAMVGPLDDVCV